MIKPLAVLATLLFTIVLSRAATGDTTVVVAHQLTNLNSPPQNDDEWVVFANTATTYQKVIMKFTLGCGTPQCSGWDYTVNTSIGKKSGTLDSAIVAIDTLTHDTTWSYTDHVDYLELGRLITPYGTYMAAGTNGFNNNWTHPYYFDVTDYAALLKDSVSVRVRYDGWTDAFSARIEFLFIEGPPAKPVVNVQQIYNTYIGYPNKAGFENVAVPVQLPVAANVTSAKVVLIMTGHGSQGEFDPHNFYIKVNGGDVYTRLLWKDDCGLNAVYPQGGTWPINRANWCPGEKVPIFEADITPFITPGQPVTIDLDFDDYTLQPTEGAGYGVSAHLITYSNQPDNDVMLEEIIAPNNEAPYLRYNPACTFPVVKIKNTGKLPLTYAEIKYGVKGGSDWYYEWTGNLPPYEEAIVELPAFDWNSTDTAERIFMAQASWPNNVPDEYPHNNQLQARYDATPVMDSVFYIFFRANNQPQENRYIVMNEQGDTITYKESFVANTVYRDTLRLQPGSYVLNFYDYDAGWGGGDGLSWWFNTQNGYENSGTLNLRRITNNAIIKNFTADFGSNVHYQFTVGYPLGSNPPKTPPSPPQHPTAINNVTGSLAQLTVYPNPAGQQVNINATLPYAQPGVIELLNLEGKVVNQYRFAHTNHVFYTINTGNMAPGFYLVNLTVSGTAIRQKLIIR